MPEHLIVLKICLRRCWVVTDARYDCPFWTILAALLAKSLFFCKQKVCYGIYITLWLDHALNQLHPISTRTLLMLHAF